MSFINPIKDSYYTSPFGYRTHPVTGVKNSRHQGIDLAIQPNTNVPVLASADGKVVRTGPLGTYGNIVIIRHTINGKTMDTNYAHLANNSILVKVGQTVKQGQRIATMGSTGSSTAPHLHFEIHNGVWDTGQPNAVDPAKYIKFYNKSQLEAQKKLAKEEEARRKLEAEQKLAQAKKDAENLEKVALSTAAKTAKTTYAGLNVQNLKSGYVKEIKAAVKDGRFSSKHELVEKYDMETLQYYAMIALARKK